MKVYVSVDIEGISNIVAAYQIISANGGGSIQETRELATKEVNAAIEGVRCRDDPGTA